MTVSEIAEQYGISRQAIHAYRRSGTFPHPVQGEGSTRLRFRADEVSAFFERNPKQPGKRTDLAPEQQQGETVTDDLVAFLWERLYEDERAARAVRVPPEWHQGPGDDPEWTDEETVCMWPPEFHTPYERDKHWRGLTVEGPELAAHIARHDPARVLREVEAKRELLARYEAMTTGVLTMTGVESIVSEYRRVLLPQLALPYADHPAFREDWRP